MKTLKHYFREPSEQAAKELFEWANKWCLPEVADGMLILNLPGRTMTLTLSNRDLTREDRVEMVMKSLDSILSERVDAEHGELWRKK